MATSKTTKARRDRLVRKIEAIRETLEETRQRVEAAAEERRAALDGMPEWAQLSERGEAVEAEAEGFSAAADAFEGIDEQLAEIVEVLSEIGQ